MVDPIGAVSLGSIAQAMRHRAMAIVEPDTLAWDLTDEEWLVIASVAIAALSPAEIVKGIGQ